MGEIFNLRRCLIYFPYFACPTVRGEIQHWERIKNKKESKVSENMRASSSLFYSGIYIWKLEYFG